MNTHGSLLGFRHYLPVESRWPYRLYDALTCKASVKGAQAIVVSSRLEYHDAIRFGVSPERLHVIPMGIDIPQTEREDSPTGPLRLLFVGRIARVRRLELILKAVARLSIDWTLTLVGGEAETSSMARAGYLKELHTLADDLGIADRLHWTGPLPPEHLAGHYQNADVFLYASRYENFGQPLLEASAWGLPLVSTPVGVAHELIDEGTTGYFTDDNPKTMADKIQRLTDLKSRQEFSEALKRKVVQSFGWEQVTEQYLQLYRDLLEDSGL